MPYSRLPYSANWGYHTFNETRVSYYLKKACSKDILKTKLLSMIDKQWMRLSLTESEKSVYILISLTRSKIIAFIVCLSWTVILFLKYLYYTPSLNNNSLSFHWMYDIPSLRSMEGGSMAFSTRSRVCQGHFFRCRCTNYVARCTQIWCFRVQVRSFLSRYTPVEMQLCPYD